MFTEDFKVHFMNELYYIVYQTEMTSVRLVNFVQCHDDDSKIICANGEGVFIMDFNY